MNQRFDTTAAPYLACFVLFRKAGKLAFVLRSNTGYMDGKYGLPAGRVEKGETTLTGAAREALEEVGVTIQPADLRHLLTTHRKSDADDTFWIDVYFEAAAWQGELYNAEPDKHGEVAWLDPANLPENMVPAIRDALGQIAAGRTYSEFGWDD